MAKKLLLSAGLFSSVLYFTMNIFIPWFYEGYDMATYTVSELSAVGAPTRSLWILMSLVYTVFILAFGWGIWITAGENRIIKIMGGLVIVYGIIDIIWPFTPMHQREVLASGGATFTDTLHISFAMVSVLIMMGLAGFGSIAFGQRFRNYSIFTIAVMILFGLLTAFEAPAVSQNLPTPYLGIYERINIGAFLCWMGVFSVKLLRREQSIIKKRRMEIAFNSYFGHGTQSLT